MGVCVGDTAELGAFVLVLEGVSGIVPTGGNVGGTVGGIGVATGGGVQTLVLQLIQLLATFQIPVSKSASPSPKLPGGKGSDP